MIELNGRYNSCKVFTDNIEQSAIGQLINMLNQSFVEGSKIRIMSDVHAGKGCVIGTTMTLTDKVVPNLVGVDIGCFTGDTKVWVDGTHYERMIDLVSLDGFRVEGFDTVNKKFGLYWATAKKTRENAELLEITYGTKGLGENDHNATVRCTPDHKFLVCCNPDGSTGGIGYKGKVTSWIEARRLLVGSRLVANCDMLYVKEVKQLTEKEDVYCLTVDEVHNFALEHGVIVHNCGMLVAELKEKRLNLPELDSYIRKKIPSGSKGAPTEHKFTQHLRLDELRCKKYANIDKARSKLCSLGGGNHFIEVDRGSDGKLYLVIHTGSRSLGHSVAMYYQDRAYEQLKEHGIENVAYELAYCTGSLMDDYIHDMDITQEFATWNREAILNNIVKELNLHVVDKFHTVHNYIDIDNMILRKGSVSATLGERLIIPMNMADGCLICTGKGNEDWNMSAPHGAGRKLCRADAKSTLSMTEYKNTMKDVYTTSVCRATLDESPMAYKPMDEILSNIEDTVTVEEIIKPIYNFKSAEE